MGTVFSRKYLRPGRQWQKPYLAEKRTDWAEDRTVQANERTYAGWMRTSPHPFPKLISG